MCARWHKPCKTFKTEARADDGRRPADQYLAAASSALGKIETKKLSKNGVKKCQIDEVIT